jgi:putative holliday junction resolvase
MPICNLPELVALLPKNTCILGLDLGDKTIGLAIADPGRSIASPLSTIQRTKFTLDAQALGKIIKERNVGGLVLGLPKNMDGSEGPQAQSVQAFARNLVAQPQLIGGDLPIAFWDERLSTAAVERFMISDDMTRKRRDAVVDKAAASWILQGALDALRLQATRS